MGMDGCRLHGCGWVQATVTATETYSLSQSQMHGYAKRMQGMRGPTLMFSG